MDRPEEGTDVKLLLRPEEAGAALGLGRSKTYELLKAGILPSVRLGHSVRVPAEALRRWVESQTNAPVESETKAPVSDTLSGTKVTSPQTEKEHSENDGAPCR
jgi:excisionase family DNA binding protein